MGNRNTGPGNKGLLGGIRDETSGTTIRLVWCAIRTLKPFADGSAIRKAENTTYLRKPSGNLHPGLGEKESDSPGAKHIRMENN
jgi:hypothetical protein